MFTGTTLVLGGLILTISNVKLILYVTLTVLAFILIYIQTIKVEENNGLSRKITDVYKTKFVKKKSIYEEDLETMTFEKKVYLLKPQLDSLLKKMASTYKVDKSAVEVEYRDGVILSSIIAILMAIVFFFTINKVLAIPILFIAYVVGNYLHIFLLESDLNLYKKGLNNEGVALMLSFNLRFPKILNAEPILNDIASEKHSEVARQVKHYIEIKKSKGLEKALEEMKESLPDVPSINLFFDLLKQLDQHGEKALQDINGYISNIISHFETESKIKINNGKTNIELVTSFFIMAPMIFALMAPMLFGKIDGENDIFYFLQFMNKF